MKVKKKLTWEIEKYGGNFNAYTSLDHTKYHIDIPNKYINKAVDILYEIINESLLEEKEIKKEIKVILNEKRISEGDESDVCIDKLLKLSIKNINTNILGNYNNIKNINRGKLIKYIEEYYTPENMILTIVGSNINKNIINKFNNINFKNKNKNKKKAKILNNIQTVYKKGILPQANIAIGFQIDIKDNLLYDLIDYILTGHYSSRLYLILREKYSLIYNINISLEYIDNNGLFIIHYSTKNNKKNIEKSIELILIELERLKKEMNDKFLNDQKNGMINKLINNMSYNDNIGDFMTYNLFYHKKIISIKEYINKINGIKNKDISTVCKNTFNINNMKLSYISKQNI